VAIKGKVFDVTAKKEMYGPGAGYNIFAGKDASKGLGEWLPAPAGGRGLMVSGMSSLNPKDAIADYSSLTEAQVKTLDQWEAFFEKAGPWYRLSSCRLTISAIQHCRASHQVDNMFWQMHTHADQAKRTLDTQSINQNDAWLRCSRLFSVFCALTRPSLLKHA